MEKNKYHILVVDDDDKIRSLIKQFLSEKGFIISSAENAEKAKAKIEIFNFNLIILVSLVNFILQFISFDGFKLFNSLIDIISDPSKDSVFLFWLSLNSKGKTPIQETLSYYMGKNSPDRQQFIIENLKIEEELLNDNI